LGLNEKALAGNREAKLMIPEVKQAAVARALRQVFGVGEHEDIRPLPGGLTSALVFRIVVRGNPYLLRLGRDAMGDLTKQFACMRMASDAGLAPRIHYTGIDDRILITDFVDGKPFPEDLARRMASTIRKLHSLPSFRNERGNIFDFTDSHVRCFQARRILPESLTDEIFRNYSELRGVYRPSDSDLVASHNDLKPQNILFDGERIWLIDWDEAAVNDRYNDLAVVANFFVKDEASEQDYLREYFGEPAGEYRSALFYLMRQIIHVSFATFFMLWAARELRVEPDLNAPGFTDFHNGVISGKVDLTRPDAKLQYARVHFNQVVENMRSRRFEDALVLVASHNGSI
jgi:aminoglycoside phosphotransferase (APT) family kinase protein